MSQAGYEDAFSGLAVSGSSIYVANDGSVFASTNSGATWTNYTTANGLGSNDVTGVCVDDGTIYAATGNGLSVSSNGGAYWITYTTANGLRSNSITCIAVD